MISSGNCERLPPARCTSKRPPAAGPSPTMTPCMLTNTTIADNSAMAGGGIDNAGTLDAVNATIAYNTVATVGSGGGLDVLNGPPMLYNTIIALKRRGTGAAQPR